MKEIFSTLISAVVNIAVIFSIIKAISGSKDRKERTNRADRGNYVPDNNRRVRKKPEFNYGRGTSHRGGTASMPLPDEEFFNELKEKAMKKLEKKKAQMPLGQHKTYDKAEGVEPFVCDEAKEAEKQSLAEERKQNEQYEKHLNEIHQPENKKVHPVFSDGIDLRQAFILSEILGTPKSKQRNTRRF